MAASFLWHSLRSRWSLGEATLAAKRRKARYVALAYMWITEGALRDNLRDYKSSSAVLSNYFRSLEPHTMHIWCMTSTFPLSTNY